MHPTPRPRMPSALQDLVVDRRTSAEENTISHPRDRAANQRPPPGLPVPDLSTSEPSSTDHSAIDIGTGRDEDPDIWWFSEYTPAIRLPQLKLGTQTTTIPAEHRPFVPLQIFGDKYPSDEVEALGIVLPDWKASCDWIEGIDPSVDQALNRGPPIPLCLRRSKIPISTQLLAEEFVKAFRCATGTRGLLFPTELGAKNCMDFVLRFDPSAQLRLERLPESPSELYRCLDPHILLVLAANASRAFSLGIMYWIYTGEGISIRFGKHLFDHVYLAHGCKPSVATENAFVQNVDHNGTVSITKATVRRSITECNYHPLYPTFNGGSSTYFEAEENQLLQPSGQSTLHAEPLKDNYNMFGGDPREDRASRIWSSVEERQTLEACRGRPSHIDLSFKNCLREGISRLVSNVYQSRLKPSKVFLYPSANKALFELHKAFSFAARQRKWLVCFGLSDIDSLKLLDLIRGGTLSQYMTSKQLDIVQHGLQQGERPLALFIGTPVQPMIESRGNLERIRALSRQYDFPVVCVDTMGVFLACDPFAVADVIVSNLAGIVNGKCNASGGCIIANPRDEHGRSIHILLQHAYQDTCFWRDTTIIARNCCNFAERIATMNNTTKILVLHLLTYGSLQSVFTVGSHGNLVYLKFRCHEDAILFYEGVRLTKGPMTGADFTVVFPCNPSTWSEEDSSASVRNTSLIRISVGLEPVGDLAAALNMAMLPCYNWMSKVKEMPIIKECF